MDVRQLKREVESLPEIVPLLQQVHQHWLAPLKKEIFPHLAEEQQETALARWQELKRSWMRAETGGHTLRKLRSQARLLQDLKLALITQDKKKAAYLLKQFVQDDVFQMRGTIEDIRVFQQATLELQQGEQEISALVEPHLPLEHRLTLHGLRPDLQPLLRLAQEQQRLCVALGKRFVSLAKEAGR